MSLLLAVVLAAAVPPPMQMPRSATPLGAIGIADGEAVVARLDAAALPAGGVHRRWFRAGTGATGQPWLVPVIVIRGVRPGPRLVVSAAIHGDELTGIDVVHRLAATTVPATLSGTLVLIAGLNAPGIAHGTRGFTPDGGDGGANLNRLMPGKANGDAAERYAHALWTGLLRPNADTLIDLHTQSRGTAYGMFAFAASPRARAIAELYAPDIVKLDRGVKGTIENMMVDDGVPAITLELGRPDMFDAAMAARAVDGTRRLMAELGMLAEGPVPGRKAFLANRLLEVRSGTPGLARLAVGLGDDVVEGQTVATLSDAFGRVVETVRAPAAGRVNTVATTPLRQAGEMLLRIVWWDPDPKCAGGC